MPPSYLLYTYGTKPLYPNRKLWLDVFNVAVKVRLDGDAVTASRPTAPLPPPKSSWIVIIIVLPGNSSVL